MNLTRRAALLSTAALAACTGTTAPTQAQVLADLQGLIPVLQATLASIVAQAPNSVPPATLAKINQLFAAAQAALANFSSANAMSVEQYLNAILAAIGAALPAAAVAFPALAQYVPIYQAAVSLVTLIIEPYINGLMGTAMAPAVRAAPMFTADQSRAILHIK